MIGAILGDIIGSKYEFIDTTNIDVSNVELLDDKNFFTDETVIMCATKYANENNISYTEVYRDFCKRYPNCGYGQMSEQWLRIPEPLPYGSEGNGCLCRVIPFIYYNKDKEEVISKMSNSVYITHNTEKSVRASSTLFSVLVFIHELKNQIGFLPSNEIKLIINNVIKKHNNIEKQSGYSYMCDVTLSQALYCFCESNTFEDCMRKVISLNCDTDTVCCICGALWECYDSKFIEGYKDKLKEYLPKELYDIARKNNEHFRD